MQEIKTVPYAPISHPFVERLIGTIRRECLDRTLFWTTADLEMKRLDFQRYYHEERPHQGLGNELLAPNSTRIGPGPVRCRERLGGLLKFYHREAA